MTAGEIFTLVLVFAAIVSVVWVFAGEFLREADVKPSDEKPDGSVIDPIQRFVSQQRLKQLRFTGALTAGGLAACVLVFFQVFDPLALLPGVGIPAVLGYLSPKWYFLSMAKKRHEAFKRKMLDLTMGLTNGLRAGMALPQALEMVSKDIGGPLQEEISVALYEYRLGMELPEALDRLNRRMPSEDFMLLSTSIRLSQQTGGSVADVLERMTDTIRQRTVFHEKLMTLTAQGRFEAIAIACAPLMAFIILYFIDPTLMGPLVQTKEGWFALGVVGMLELIGFLIINKIVTIEV